MSFVPYIHFQGNCADAMRFYHEVFGGALYVMTYAEAPDAAPAMAGSPLVMHACLTIGQQMLMAGDFPPGMAGDPQQAVSISHTAADDATASALCDRLVAGGGTVIMPFGPTFWSSGFGMLRDRFGTHWMVAGPSEAQG